MIGLRRPIALRLDGTGGPLADQRHRQRRRLARFEQRATPAVGRCDRTGDDSRDKTPRRMPDRMAGGAFALAADPSLLAAHARHRGRLHHRGGAARRVRRIRAAAVDCTASSAPTSPFRTRSARWRCRSRTSAPAPSAPPIRCGTRTANCARPTPTSKASSTISTPARPDGTAPTTRWCSAPAASSRAVVFGLLERGIKRVHLANRTLDARAGAGRSVRRHVHPVAWETDRRGAAARGPAGEYDLARHARPAAARDRRRPAAAGRRGRRSRLCAAGNAAAGGGARARTASRRRARHAAAPGGARLRIVVRAAPEGHAGTARAGRGRSQPRSARPADAADASVSAGWKPLIRRAQERTCAPERATFSHKGRRKTDESRRSSKSPARGRRSRRWC